MPFSGLRAGEWKASGDSVSALGYALTGGVYTNGDVIVETPGSTNASFVASDSDYTLDIYSMLYNSGVITAFPCSLKINGDILLDATQHDMIVNINPDDATNYETIIYPYVQNYAIPGQATSELGYAQVIFWTGVKEDDTYSTITVNLMQDLVFSGTDNKGVGRDMIVTFKGPGQTVFEMYDGTAVKFDGQIDYSGGLFLMDDTGAFQWWGVSSTNGSINAGKTRVYVTMDQTKDDVDAGNHKVLFERANDGYDPSARVMVYVGHNSFITYLSDNDTGIEGATDGGYASVGFDPSNVNTGRMVLFLKGAYWTGWQIGLEDTDPLYWSIVERYPLQDAAVVVAGHHVNSFAAADIRDTVDFSTPAGMDARFEVIDNQYYNVAESGLTYNVADSRGLLVVNDAQSLSKLASDPYWDFWNYNPDSPADYYGPFWAYSINYDRSELPIHDLDLNVRRGFVVGINGQLNVYDNAFLDYTAGSINKPDDIAFYGTPSEDPETIAPTPDFDPSILKKRNPSALVIDGMDEGLYYGDPYCIYSAGNPFLHNPYSLDEDKAGIDAKHGEINLYGHARAYFKNSASDYSPYYGYMYNFWSQELIQDYIGPVDDINLDWDQALLVGEPDYETGIAEKSTYDGFQLSVNPHTVVEGEGNHVLDVEGKLSASTWLNVAINSGRAKYADSVKAGIIAMSSVLKDYTGREVNGDPVLPLVYTPFDRPLLNDGTTYWRYNSPGFYFNDHAQFWNGITLRHDEATKYVNCLPWDSEPAYTGGERLFFSFDQWNDAESMAYAPDRYRLPEIRFFNSGFEFHESACASGVRFVIKDIPGLQSTNGTNVSWFRWYDHGDQLDTLLTKHGRIFQLSSMYNFMADDKTNYATESAPFNVYKGNKPLTSDSATVTLSLQRGNEFPGGVYLPKQIAHNLFLISQPDAEGSSCYLKIGWEPNIFSVDLLTRIPPALAGIPIAEQGGYPYEVLPGNEDYEYSLNIIDQTLPCPPAVVSVDGELITFGSFDKDGNSPTVPVTNYTNDGIIYILHGGKMTITRPPTDVLPIDRNSIPYQTCIDTMVTKNIWNDWNLAGTERTVWFSGIFDLPHDQVTWGSEGSLKGYGLQPFGFTETMMEARSEETDGYIRIDFNNETRTNRFDKTGDEEVVIGWFQRDALPALSTTKNGTLVRTIKSSSRLTSNLRNFITRATESVGAPVPPPDYLLYIGAPDDITQMRVTGATMADPLHLDISGNYDEAGLPKVARVREFTTQKTTNGLVTQHFIGEGQHAVLFGEYGGIIGLGDRHWNEFSPLAWNLLGKDYVSVAPLGDMTVVLNSNLIVADRLPLIATTKFASTKSDRVTFYSAIPLEIRIPAGCELDLSAFGQSEYLQEIEFAGQVRLVLEDGATIRFPTPSSVQGGVVLYFNDDSQMIFEGVELPGKYVTPADTSFDIIKIMGKGQIWLNKNAKMLVNSDVHVGVMSDDLTPITDLTISIQRQAAMYIGDDTVSGGIFQVGNPVSVENGTVNFKLAINGVQAKFQIDREGFFGLGAGILNRIPGNLMNGNAVIDNNPVLAENSLYVQLDADGNPVFTPDETNAWQVVALKNVGTVNIEVTNGIIQHNNIVDGSNSNASIWAIGPATSYILSLNPLNQSIIRGGGNLMYIPATPAITRLTYHSVNIWDYAGPVINGEEYAIIGSAPMIMNRTIVNGTRSDFGTKGRTATFVSAQAFFDHISSQVYADQQNKCVSVGAVQFATVVGYENTAFFPPYYDTMNRIVRDLNPVFPTEVAENEGLETGALQCRNDGSNSDPRIYGIVNR